MRTTTHYDAASDPEVSDFERQREEAKQAGTLEELEHFRWIIEHCDPAPSAWNPVTGLEPVLCRVCGQSSDPRIGRVLTHRPGFECAPVDQEPLSGAEGGPVRDTVLLKSATMRETALPPRQGLQPHEILEISVRAFQDGQRGGGAIRECTYCLGLSPHPTWPVRHAEHACSTPTDAPPDTVHVADVDPASLYVAAMHLPGARSITDPDWYYLDGGWWVAPEGTKGPGWAGYWSASDPLAEVALVARRPQPSTVVRLTAKDRRQSSEVAAKLDRLADYFRALDRPETLHAVAALTQTMAAAVTQTWQTLRNAHFTDDGVTLHEALGGQEHCPVCVAEATSPATEQEEEYLAETIQARMANDGARRLPVKVVWVILREANRAQITLNQIDGHPFSVAVRVADRANARVGSYPDLRGWVVSTADASRVLQAYRWHIVDGTP